MKILYPDCINTISTGSADSDYPASNMLDNHPQKYWLAGSGQTTETVTIVTTTGAVNGLGLFNTNATSGTVDVKNEAEDTTYETFALSGILGRFFVEFASEYTEILHIIIELTAADDVYVGVARCGTLLDFPDPRYGLRQNRVDYSVKEELSNGGLYVYKRNTPRAYALDFIMSRTQFNSLDSLFNTNGSLPLAILLSEKAGDDDRWGGFFHILDPPEGQYIQAQNIGVDIEVQEAV